MTSEQYKLTKNANMRTACDACYLAMLLSFPRQYNSIEIFFADAGNACRQLIAETPSLVGAERKSNK